MPTRISETVKSAVIQQWLEGIARDTIAANNDLSGGGVTNIINEWKQGLGSSVADGLRELAVASKKIGITPAQCASGCRVEKIMINLGVKENGFEPFILEIYNRCKDLGLTPENIASHLKDLLDFSTTDAIPFSQIRNYVKQKADEKEKLEQEIKKLEWKIEMLTLEQSDRQFLRDQAFQDEKMTAADLRWYSNLKAELGKYDIPVDDISKFAKAVSGIRELGYDVGKVIREFSDYESVETQRKMLQDSVKMLQNELNHLSQKCSSLENTVNSHEQIISIFKELEGMGFGLEELKLLWNTINEIAVANNIPLNEAQRKFFKGVEEQYDKKLGFESKVQNLKAEVNKLTQEKKRLHEELLAQPLIGPILIGLFQIGVNEQDIINMAYIFQRHADGGSSSTSISIDTQTLIAELQKYGSIKSTIEQLDQKADKLRNEIASLKAQKQDILARSIYSRQSYQIYSGPLIY
jgi:hypothetical protein